MKTFCLQPGKFASLFVSNRLVATPIAKKFRLGRSIFFFLSLLIVSACAGTQFQPSAQIPRDVHVGSPLSVAAVNQFPARVSGGGSLRVLTVDAQGGHVQQVNKNLQIGVGANYQFADFNFTGLNFYASRPWDEVHFIGAAIPIIYTLSDKWSLVLLPVGQWAGEPDARFAKSLIYGGVVGATYTFDKDRIIGLGVGGLYNLAQASVFPFVVVNWKLSDYFRLNTPYRAGPSGPGGIELTYTPIKDLELAIGASYQSKRFRLSERNVIANGIGQYDTLPVFARLSYRIFPPVEVNLYGGASLYNYIVVDDSRGDQLFHTHHNVAPFVGGGLSLKL
jgi:hypothetical protein